MANLKTSYTDGARALFFRAGIVLARHGFTADLMTLIGLGLQAAAVPLIVTGNFFWALAVGLIASLCDALDGAVARAGAGPTKAGAFLDSTLDRVSELLIGAALVAYFVREGPDWAAVVAALVFMGASQMVSYTRARAEALGVECKVGFMSRPERLVGLGIGFLLAWWDIAGTSFLVWMLYLLAAGTTATVVHRILHTLHKLREVENPPAFDAAPVAGAADPGPSDGLEELAADDLWPASGGRRGRDS